MANITLEAVELVMEQAKVEFPAAKQALLDADGSVEDAVRALAPDNSGEPIADAEYTAAADAEDACAQNEDAKKAAEDTFDSADKNAAADDMFPVDEIIDKLKKLVKSGNVDRIVVSRGDDTILNIPVNVGLLGSVIGLAAAPWAVIAAAVAAFGFSCKIEIVKKDGTKEEVE
jgi:hypothetical protein